MVSPVPCTLIFPVLPYFAGEGPAALPGLWVGAPQGWGLPCSLLVQPQKHGYTLGAAPSSPGLEAPGMQLTGTWCTAPLGSPGSVSLQKQEHVRNITTKILSFFLPAAAERLPSPGQLQSVCLLPILSTNIIISLPAFKLTPNILTEEGWEAITFAVPLAHPRGQQPLSLRQQQPQRRI